MDRNPLDDVELPGNNASPLDSVVVPDGYEPPSSFRKALTNVGGSTLSGVGRALKDIGLDSVGDAALRKGGEIQLDTQPTVQSFSDIADHPGDYVAESAGQMAGQAGLALAGGTIGGAIGAGLGSLAGPLAPVAVPALSAAGSYVGGNLPMLAQEYGSEREQQQQKGLDDKGRALAGAAATTAIENLGGFKPGGMVGAGKQIVSDLAGKGVKEGAKILGKKAIKAGLQEAAEEIPQQYTGAYGGGTDIENINTPKNAEQAAFGAAMALPGGALFGAGNALIDHARAPRGPIERAVQAGGVQSQPTTGGQNGINTEASSLSSPDQTQQSEPGAPAMPDESVLFEPEQPSGQAGGANSQGSIDVAANPHEAYQKRAALKKRLIDTRQALKTGEDPDGSLAQELAGIETEYSALDAGLIDWEQNSEEGKAHRKESLEIKKNAAAGDTVTHPIHGEVKITNAGRTSATISTLDDQPLGEAPYHALKDLKKPQPRTEYDDVIKAAADKHGVPAEFLKAVALQESGAKQFDADGKTIKPSTSNALGIMQIIPKWHPEFDAERLANDPEYNINAGAQFLGDLIKKHGGDLHKAAQSYYGSKDAAENSRYADSVLSRMGGTNPEAGSNEKRAEQDSQGSRGNAEGFSTSGDNGAPDHSQIAAAGNGEVTGEEEKQVRIPESDQEITPPEDVVPGAIRTQGLETQEAAGSGNTEVLQGGDQFANSAGTTEASTSNEMPANDDQASAGSIPDVFVATHELSDGTQVTRVDGNTYRDENGDEYQDDYAEKLQPASEPVGRNDRHEPTVPANAVGRNDGGVSQAEPTQAPTGKVADDSSINSVEGVNSAIDAAAHEAATSPLNDLPEPTLTQKEAGNYKKAHVKLHGFDIAIENPKGSKRTGTDPDGKDWSVDMAHHYGYIKRSTGADNEHIDVFVGDHHDSDKAYVVNQIDPKTGKFDEHKIMLGFENKAKAKVGYLKNYAKGWKGLGSITEVPVSELKAKIESGAIRKPIRNHTTEIPVAEYEQATKVSDVQGGRTGGESIPSTAQQPTGSQQWQNKNGKAAAKSADMPLNTGAAFVAPDIQQSNQEANRDQSTNQAEKETAAGESVTVIDDEIEKSTKTQAGGQNLAGDVGGLATETNAEIQNKVGGQVDGQQVNEPTEANNRIPAIQPDPQNSNPNPAQPVAPAAQKDLAGKIAEPVAKRKAIVNDTDDMLAAIAKLGGLNRDEAKAQGIDPAAFNHRGSGIKRVFTKAGRSYDEMAELLRGYNFDVPLANDLVDKVSRSINQGEKFHTPAGHERMMELQAQELFSDEQAKLALDLESLINNEDLDESAIDFLIEQYDDNIDMGREMSPEELEDFWGAIDEQTDKTTTGGRSEVSQEKEILGGYTESELADRAKSEKQRLKQEETDQVKAEQKAKADRERDSLFDDLAGTAPKTEDVFGMKDPLENINKKPEPSSNKVFTDDAAVAAREILKKKLGTLNSGIDPELMQAGITLAGYHIEKGARTFAAYSKAMITDLGEVVKPYLKSWYMGVKYDPRATGFDGMDSASIVDSFDLKNLEQDNAPSTDINLESDSGNANAEKRGNEPAVPDGRPGTDRDTGSASGRVEKEGERSGSNSGAAIDAALTGRKRGNKPVRSAERPALSSELAPGVADSERGGNDSNAGIQAEPPASAEIKALAEQGNQKAVAVTRRVIPSDPNNIAATLPMLNDGQKADVLFAENRLSGHKGVLFTNGTGTGKTFSGLGIAKRFHLQGKKNIIVVVPSINIADQWAKAAGSFFDMNINLLENTREAGNGPVITTYANFGMNQSLVSRDWDLVIADEAHKLMQSESGDRTDALNTLRGITYHRHGFFPWFNAKYADVVQALHSARSNHEAFSKDDTMDQLYRAAKLAYDKAQAKYNETRKAAEAEYDGLSRAKDPKVVFLSATPFAYVKAIDYAEGYLFEYGTDRSGAAYNSGDNQDQFFMQHFGYRMRYNKLTRPDANVDSGIMERQFNTTLRRTGALSFRSLDVNFDYDRKFILVESAIGRRIDEAMEWIREQKYQLLADELKEKFGHLERRYLLEAIKAQEVIPVIKQHLAMGRKVLVFHDYKKGGTVNPFIFSSKGNDDLSKQIADFNAKFGDLAKSFVALPSPINAFRKAFGDEVMIYNGDINPKERIKLAGQFNNDTSGKNLILVQSASAKEGVSFHDTTGKHQRVLLNIGLPTQPTTAIQQEGRIYRVGQQSDALFRYLNTGTNWERWAFASTIAQRASTAENLAAGEGARALKDAFINAFEESDAYPAGHDGEGKGGKAADKAASSLLSEFDRAKSLYFGQQKKTARTKSAEGVDYYATPEPVGLKMVEIADIRPGESALEPSAGHGAIARWFRDDAKKTAVEPSGDLGSRLALVFDGDIRRETFEDLNIVNKYDAIVMNPPFGVGGKTAIEHLAKAAKHLRMNGRIVALIPEGPSTDKRFDAWMESEAAKDFYLAANISLPSSTFERAGTGVKTRIVVVDKVSEADAGKVQQQNRDYSNAENIKELFERIENLSIRPRNVPEQAEAQKPESWRDQVTKADAAAKQSEKAAQESGTIAESADKATFELKGDKILTNAPASQVTTKKGKVLDGVFVPNEGMAKAVDQFTYQANGRGNGWFVRLRHIERPSGEVKASKGDAKSGSTVDDVKSWLPKRVKRLIDSGKLRVVQSISDLPAHLQERGSALYHAAWHGTPHDFEKFSLEHIGNGEGVQAYGHGLYFADSRGVAEWYREKLSVDSVSDPNILEQYFKPGNIIPSYSGQDKVLEYYPAKQDDNGYEPWYVKVVAVDKDGNPVRSERPRIHSTLPSPKHVEKVLGIRPGKLYQVELAPEQDEYLLWDKPFTEQSQKIQDILKLEGWGRSSQTTGMDIYIRLSDTMDSDKAVSEFLQSLGIRGIKYLDGTSRSGERENYNYVIFSDEDINITAKYSKLNGVEALYDEKRDQIVLVADMLNQDNLNPVLAHELLHRAEAIDPQLKAAISSFEDQFARSFKHAAAGRGSAIEKAAYRRVIDAETPASNRSAEYRAYLVTEYSRNPDSFGGLIKKAIQDLIAAIRAALIRSGLDMGFIRSLTPADLAAMSRYGAKVASSNVKQDSAIGKETKEGVKFSQAPNPVRDSAMKKAGLVKTQDNRTLIQKAGDWVKSMRREWETTGRDRIKEGVFDRLHGIYAAERDLLGGLSAEQSGYVAARLSTGGSSIMYGLLLKGAPEWDATGSQLEKVAGSKGLTDIFGRVADDMESFFGWMIGNRAARLMAEGRENNFTADEIKELIALGKGKEKLFESVRDEYNEFKAHVLDAAEAAGLIDPAKRLTWDQGDYIPFYRVMDDDGSTKGPRNKRGFSHQTSGIKQLKGGAAALGDPLENIVRNFAHLIDASIKNNAIRKVANNFDGSGILEEIPRTKYTKALVPMTQFKKLLIEQEAERMINAGMDRDEAMSIAESIIDQLPQDALEGFREMWAIEPPSDPDVVRVMDEGRTHYYRVHDDALLRGLTGINQRNNNEILKIMRTFKRVLTTGVTADPTFMMRNFIRDAAHAYTINEDGFRFGIDSVNGALKSLREEGGSIDMVFSGASFIGGYINGNDPEAMASAIRRALAKKGLNGRVADSYMKSVVLKAEDLWDRYRHVGDQIENANREAVYEAALRKGKSKTQALFESKDLMDYSMQGNFAAVQLLADVLPFFNARLQGLYKLGRAGLTRKQIMHKALLMAGISLALLAANWDDDRYEELEDWDKDANWHIFLGDEHIRIPKPFEVGLMFGTVPERMMRNLGGKEDTRKSAERLLWMLGETFAMNPTPQIIKPGIEVWGNKDTFTHRPIETLADESKLPSARYDEHTSDTMRWVSSYIGDATGLSPKRLEHLWRGYLGSMGMYLLTASDVAFRLAEGKDIMRESIEATDIPVLRAFATPGVQHNTRFKTELYDMANEVEQIYRTVNAKKKEGDLEGAKTLMQENADRLRYRKVLSNGTNALKEIRGQINGIYRNPRFTPAERKERIDALTLRGNDIAKSIIDRVENR
jgi:hypothetical protein